MPSTDSPHVAIWMRSKTKDTTLQDNGQKGKNALMVSTTLSLSGLPPTKAAPEIPRAAFVFIREMRVVFYATIRPMACPV